MRVLLIYNPNAGDGVQAQLRDLVDLIHDAGYQVRCRSSKDPQVAAALAEPTDLVAVAGGDGTVVKVARLLRGRDTAIAPLPVGTANNIATALGLMGPSLEEQIAGWSSARVIAIDVGVVKGPARSRSFLEACGAGLIPRLLTLARNRDALRPAATAEARLESAVTRACRTAGRSPAIEVQAELDGLDLSGRYVLFEAMNVGWVGPNLNLAPGADPSDGLLDVVRVTEAERDVLIGCLEARERGAPWRHALPTLRGRRLRVDRVELGLHVDDEIWPEAASETLSLEITVRDSTLFLVPAEASAKPWMRNAGRDMRPGAQPARANATSSRWAWPAGRRARFHR